MLSPEITEKLLNEMLASSKTGRSSSSLIFHYTDINGLHGIISNKKLWITKSDFLNDSSEIKYYDAVANEIKNDDGSINMDNISSAIIEETKCPLSFVDFCKKYEIYAQNALSYFTETFDIFILSLTPNPDSLTLWSSYSNNIGYNIGFKNSLFHYWMELKYAIHYGKVIYNKQAQRNAIRKQYLTAYLHFSYLLPRTDFTSFFTKDDLLNKVFDLLFSSQKINSMFYKNHLFKPENEYRIAFLNGSQEWQKHYKIPQDKHIHKFRPRNDAIIPYIEIPIRIEDIACINIGPKNNIDIAKKGLELFLKEYGYQIPAINKSSIALRY